MTQRQNNKSSPRIALIIPAQQVPDSGSFPTTKKAVSNWLLAAASGGIEARVAALITALQHSNRLQNTPTERLKILDIFIIELQQLLPDLRARFADTQLPFSESAENAFSQTALLLQEISYGYKISLVDALLKRGSLTQKVRVHTIYRAIKAIGDCGLHQSLGYRKWPHRSWRDLNTLMLLAEHEKAQEIPINTGSAQNYPESIQALYIGYMLLNASDTQHLQRHEISTLFTLLCSSAGKFRLTTHKNQNATNQDFSVALNSANAPAADRFCKYPDNAKIRYISLEPLMSLFSTGFSAQHRAGNLSHSQQRQLTHQWLHNSQRKIPRSIRNTNLFAQTGLDNIATTLSNASPHRKFSELFPDHWLLRNQSAGGIGLQAGSKDINGIDVGELMAYAAVQSGKGNKPWCQVGVIRWLSNEKQQPITLGIETIAERVECVTITPGNTQRGETSIDALLGIDPFATDTQLTLLVARHCVVAGESITLSVGASSCYRNCILSLGDRIDQTGNFDCFTLDTTPLK